MSRSQSDRESIMEQTPKKVIFFDLDDTLFDRRRSVRLAISTIQRKSTSLSGRSAEELAYLYSMTRQHLRVGKAKSYEEEDMRKVQLFFAAAGLSKPSPGEIDEFWHAHRDSQTATPGSIETLARLRENGYRIVLITNGSIFYQTQKAHAIGIMHLVDRIITSEEAGYRKPSRKVFQYATELVNAPPDTFMIGDSVCADIKGALNAQLPAILYKPKSCTSEIDVLGQKVPIIHQMSEVLERFGITTPQFDLVIDEVDDKLAIKDLGIDLVTETRCSLKISKESVRVHAQRMGAVLHCTSKKRYTAAMWHIKGMIRTIAKSTPFIDEDKIEILIPSPKLCDEDFFTAYCDITERKHSIRGEYKSLVLQADLDNRDALREVVTILQDHAHAWMRDDPRASLCQLRRAMYILAENEGIAMDVVVSGEQIEQEAMSRSTL